MDRFTDPTLEQRDSIPDVPQPDTERVLLDWQAPARPFKKKTAQYYITITLIVGLIALIFAMGGQFLVVAVVIAVAFLAYVMAAVPPNMAHHQVTNIGIRSDGQLFVWEEMGRFWFESQAEVMLVHIELRRFPFRITLLLGEQPANDVKTLLEQALLHERPQPTAFENAAAWLKRMIPLET
jgi:hypothetical protein